MGTACHCILKIASQGHYRYITRSQSDVSAHYVFFCQAAHLGPDI